MVFKSPAGIVLQSGFSTETCNEFLAIIDNCERNFNFLSHQNENISHDKNISKLKLKIWPNPFRAFAYFQFHLAKEEKVSVQILNFDGRIIENLVNNELKLKGNHQIYFNGSQLESGIYYVRVIMEDKIITRKLISIR